MGYSTGKIIRRAVLGIRNFLLKTEKYPHVSLNHFSVKRLPFHEGVPTPKRALIHEKCALLFGESPDSLPFLLTGTISELKMASISGHREANLWLEGLEEGEGEGRAVLEGSRNRYKRSEDLGDFATPCHGGSPGM